MHFVIYCIDKPGHGNVRADNRPAHIDFLNASASKIVAAGPMLSDDGNAMVGSTLIVEFADKAEAQAWAGSDPYAQAGLFERVDITPWKKVIPAD